LRETKAKCSRASTEAAQSDEVSLYAEKTPIILTRVMARPKSPPRLCLDKNNYAISASYNCHRYRFSLSLTESTVNRKLAEKILDVVKCDIETGEFDTTLTKYRYHAKTGKPLTTMPLFEGYETWVKDKAKSVDKNTANWYRAVLHSLKTSIGARPLSQVNRKDVLAFIRHCQKTNAAYTVKRKVQAVSLAYDWLTLMGYCLANPFKEADKLVKKQSMNKRKPFTALEKEAILTLAKKDDRYSHYYPLLLFLFETGCRTGEALGLRYGDITSHFTQITLDTQLTRGKRKPVKADSARTFKVSNRVADMLYACALCCAPKDEDLVFTSPEGKPIRLDNFRRRIWYPMLSELRIAKRPLYATRHTFVSNALASGVDPMAISQITGHNPQTMFAHYASHVNSKVEIPNNIYGGEE
jgi:integrase